jgi:adenine-specific DNA-methyltransferase
MLQIGARADDLVLDFFGGSGTTGHAVWRRNAGDGRTRRFILVQLPLRLDPSKKDEQVAAEYCDRIEKNRTIAELTKERLRRAGDSVRTEDPLFAGDLGFRVFKLDSSNLNTWSADRDNLEGTLLDSVEHIKADRTEQDVLYELLLKLGLDLCVPIETRQIATKDIHSIGAGALIACLATTLSRDEAEQVAEGIVAWLKELKPAGDVQCVFRDSAFVDDVAKSNLAAILHQHGVTSVRSL